MSARFIQGDVFEVEMPRRAAALVYADPPYANCRFHYARRVRSRQWGADARRDFLREMIARMDDLRAPDGVCAVSLAVSELKALALFPTVHRVLAWVKTCAGGKPNVWPTYAWEPVVCWGAWPSHARDGEGSRPAPPPKDWLSASPARPRKGGHETPKPPAFAEWLLDLTLGPRTGLVVELFAGSCPVAKAAAARRCSALAVDLVQFADGLEPAGAAP